MKGWPPSNPPTEPDLNDMSASRSQCKVGSLRSMISVFLPNLFGAPVAIMILAERQKSLVLKNLDGKMETYNCRT